MLRHHIVGSILVAALVVAPHTGHGQPKNASPAADDNLYDVDTSGEKAPAAGTALAKMLDSLHVRACVRSDVAPFGSFSNGALQGFDIELARELVNEISIDFKQALRVDWVVVSGDERQKRLQDGACDILVADFSYTKERANQVGTSKVYLRTDKVMIAAAKITRKTPVIAKLANATGGTGDVKGTAKDFDSYQQIVHAMDNGEVDYVVTDRPIAEHLVRSSVTPFKVSKVIAENAESYVVGVQKGNAELLQAVDRGLANLAHTGRLALLARRWL